MKAPLPPDEATRLETLWRYDIANIESDSTLDNFACLSAYIAKTPCGLVTFIDRELQYIKGRFGTFVKETSRDISLGSHALFEDIVLVVPDTHEDERFKDNPLVVEDPFIRFYAAFPLIPPQGIKLGMLCVLDVVPRQLNAEELAQLHLLSKQTVTYLEQRRELLSFERAINIYKSREAKHQP